MLAEVPIWLFAGALVVAGWLVNRWMRRQRLDASTDDHGENAPTPPDLKNVMLPPEIADAMKLLSKAHVQDLVMRQPDATSECYDKAAACVEALEKVVRNKHGENEKSGRYLRYLVNAGRHTASGYVRNFRPTHAESAYALAQILIFSRWSARIQAGRYDPAYEYGRAFDGSDDRQPDRFRDYVVDERHG